MEPVPLFVTQTLTVAAKHLVQLMLCDRIGSDEAVCVTQLQHPLREEEKRNQEKEYAESERG